MTRSHCKNRIIFVLTILWNGAATDGAIMADGNYILDAFITDGDGNDSPHAQVNLTVDRTSPNASVAVPGGGSLPNPLPPGSGVSVTANSSGASGSISVPDIGQPRISSNPAIGMTIAASVPNLDISTENNAWNINNKRSLTS